MNGHIETEVKLSVPDHTVIAERLQALGATLTKPRVFEYNVRYENAERTLTTQGIVLRLRKDTRVRLTYKGLAFVQAGIGSRYEAEVELDDFETMETILGKLGYFPDMVYEKYRTTYELDGAEIVLDEMPYGRFVEIEGDAEIITALIDRLGLNDATRYLTSYSRLFVYVKHNLGLDFRDLTFANFDGIDVPHSAFVPPK